MTEIELIEQTALRVGMRSLLNQGAGSCVFTEGCDGVSQDHLIAFTREVALHCAVQLADFAPAPAASGAAPALLSKTDIARIWRRVTGGVQFQPHEYVLFRAIADEAAALASREASDVMVDMVPPATARDRWMYEQGRLAERDPRTHQSAALASPQVAPARVTAEMVRAQQAAVREAAEIDAGLKSIRKELDALAAPVQVAPAGYLIDQGTGYARDGFQKLPPSKAHLAAIKAGGGSVTPLYAAPIQPGAAADDARDALMRAARRIESGVQIADLFGQPVVLDERARASIGWMLRAMSSTPAAKPADPAEDQP